ncbi:MAG: NAD-dependent epimerase/dehydratase family protein [Bacteroidota bacterium]
MKYFLTGATGFLGGALARILRERGHDVVALVRSPEKASKLKALGVSLVPGDIVDKESMRNAMIGCDGVFHVAAWYKVGARDRSTAWKINVEGTRNVLELMKELNITKGVYTSTLAVNSDTHGTFPDETLHFTGTHISEYDRTKAAAHDIALEFIKNGLPLVVVMPGLIYGPDGTSMSDDALRLFLKKRLPMIPKRAAYCWAHVDDVAEAHILAMEKGTSGEKYIISGEYSLLTDAFALASSLMNIRGPFTVPPELLKISSLFVSVIEKIIPLPEMYSSEAMRVQAGVTYLGDNSKAKRELGYAPRTLKEGLKQTLTYELAKMKRR